MLYLTMYIIHNTCYIFYYKDFVNNILYKKILYKHHNYSNVSRSTNIMNVYNTYNTIIGIT